MESVVDVIKHAIENEVQAKVFYGKASDLAKSGESQMVFMELVEMEDTHAQRLVDGFGELLKQEGVDAAAFLAGLEANLERTLVNEQLQLLENAEMRPVIEFAIGMEQRARDNYLGLAERVEGDDLVKLCHELAGEEQKHFDLLTEARVGVDTPIDERPAL
jgi:rubrerythrin